MAQLTPTGYVLKNQNQWFDEERQLYVDIDTNWNLDPSTPDGLKLASDAETFANLDEVGQQAYNSKDPNKAKDNDLNTICSLTGTVRSQGTPSNVSLTLGGVAGTVIVAGKLVESAIDGSQWAIDSNVTIQGGGTVAATATAIINGATQASIGTITRIVDTVGGWQTVTNPSVATPGTDRQNDSSLRLERSRSVSRPGSNQIDNMIGELFAVDGVRRVRVYENFTGVVDGDGLPAHSEAPIVDGGGDDDVAIAIFRKKNPGCALHAAGTPVIVPDVFDKYPSNTKTISFSRPTYVDMIVAVTVQNDGTLPNNADQLIKDAILSYTSGDFIDAECGFNQLGFDIGENVPVSRMYTPVNQVIGQYGNSYIGGLSVNGQTTNEVVIAFSELSRWTESNITVSIV